MMDWRYFLLLFAIAFVFIYHEELLYFDDIQAKFKVAPFFSRLLQKKDCTGNLKKILLAINLEKLDSLSISILQKFYVGVFGKVVFCGIKDFPGVIEIPANRPSLGYSCLATAMQKYPNFTGYIQSNDDIVLNWWNLIRFDALKLWISSEVDYQNDVHMFGDHKRSQWWRKNDPNLKCEAAFRNILDDQITGDKPIFNLTPYIRRFYHNTNKRNICIHGRSDIFYIPTEFTNAFVELSHAYENISIDISIPTILTFFLNKTNHVNLNGLYLAHKEDLSEMYGSIDHLSGAYSFLAPFYHPFKLGEKMNNEFFTNIIMAYGDVIKRSCVSNRQRILAETLIIATSPHINEAILETSED